MKAKPCSLHCLHERLHYEDQMNRDTDFYKRLNKHFKKTVHPSLYSSIASARWERFVTHLLQESQGGKILFYACCLRLHYFQSLIYYTVDGFYS